ncbi:hydrolytic ATP binding site of dynein motor region D1-domain-containing protein [Russula dissimulans]|nr:hydrolytic ATP binding site of dynein motor region D1-domain-containing protein [Russula dissimulans]
MSGLKNSPFGKRLRATQQDRDEDGPHRSHPPTPSLALLLRRHLPSTHPGLVPAKVVGWSHQRSSITDQTRTTATVSCRFVPSRDAGDLRTSYNLMKESGPSTPSQNRVIPTESDAAKELSPVTRKKCEHLITELVHQRDVTRTLIQQRATDNKSFAWLYQMRFYLDRATENLFDRLVIRVADASFPYGWEYLGVPERLVQTPLTDRCYLTLTQALGTQLGGAPFGPTGTGKTESVKALALQLGRFVLVFCCDETFDFQAMGRIFVGLCQVGAWGCFDEFNRLEERILSAVSQQVQSIQQGLAALVKNPNAEIELVGKNLKINKNIGIFITTNPNYAGRSQLPPNLTKLFRPMAMTRPDRELIAQVMLFSQGFRTAESLASKIVPFFNLCDEQLSPQPHYDFGLRALKAVLASAGILKRERLQDARSSGDNPDLAGLSDVVSEQVILITTWLRTLRF